MLKHKAEQWNANQEIQSILKELGKSVPGTPAVGKYSKQGAAVLLNHEFNKDLILQKRLPYERLDQLTIDVLLAGC
jgi:hypothetical protein